MEIVKGFIKTYLDIEMAYDYLPTVRMTIPTFSPAWGESVRSELEQLIASRSISAPEYYDLTWIEFESAEALYEYLSKVYEYLFAGSEVVPVPPES